MDVEASGEVIVIGFLPQALHMVRVLYLVPRLEARSMLNVMEAGCVGRVDKVSEVSSTIDDVDKRREVVGNIDEGVVTRAVIRQARSRKRRNEPKESM